MNAEIKLKDMTDEQIADLEAQIAELRKAKERKPLAWKPEIMETYFLIGGYGDKLCDCLNYPPADSGVYTQGNMFPTEELRDAELERRKIIREIEELVDKYDSERGGAFVVGDANFTFMYDATTNKVGFDLWWTDIHNPIIPSFSSQEIAQRILDEIGEDRVKLLFTKYPIVRGEE